MQPSRHADIVAALCRAASDMTALWPLRKRHIMRRVAPDRPPSQASSDASRMAL
jgi:hypothetical protein